MIAALPEGWVVSVDTPDEVEVVRDDAEKGARGHYACINFGGLLTQDTRLGDVCPRVHTRGATVEVVEAALKIWHSSPRSKPSCEVSS